MRTTKSLSKAYLALQEECMEKIKSFFKGKSYVRIQIMPSQHLSVEAGYGHATVTEIRSNGDIIADINGTSTIWEPSRDSFMPVDALLTILDELERMKKHNQLKKP